MTKTPKNSCIDPPEHLEWIVDHEWQIDSCWEDLARFFQCLEDWGQYGRPFSEIQELLRFVIINVAPTLLVNKTAFEKNLAKLPLDAIPPNDILMLLNLAQLVIRRNLGSPAFAWSLEWQNDIAMHDMESYDRHIGHLLENTEYPDESLLPMVVRALSMPNVNLERMESLTRPRGPIIRNAFKLALLVSYDEFRSTETLNKNVLFKYIYTGSAPVFDEQMTSYDLIREIFPQLLPAWESIRVLNLPFEQVWPLFESTHSPKDYAVLPTGLDLFMP